MIDVKKIALTSCGKIVNARSISPSTTLCPGGGGLPYETDGDARRLA